MGNVISEIVQQPTNAASPVRAAFKALDREGDNDLERIILDCKCFASTPRTKQNVKDAFEKKDWGAIVWLHHRFCRLGVFEAISSLGLLPDQEYWELLREVWCDAETSFLSPGRWIALMINPSRGDSSCFMTAEEKENLNNLPDEFTVYRGYRPDLGNENGLSWTLKREIAERLGNRTWRLSRRDDMPVADPLNRGRVLEKRIRKSEVFAHITKSREAEIILIPSRPVGTNGPRLDPEKIFHWDHETSDMTAMEDDILDGEVPLCKWCGENEAVQLTVTEDDDLDFTGIGSPENTDLIVKNAVNTDDTDSDDEDDEEDHEGNDKPRVYIVEGFCSETCIQLKEQFKYAMAKSE
jgi:hypothetical protein